jgi:hypothetical protein
MISFNPFPDRLDVPASRLQPCSPGAVALR